MYIIYNRLHIIYNLPDGSGHGVRHTPVRDEGHGLYWDLRQRGPRIMEHKRAHLWIFIDFYSFFIDCLLIFY